MIPGDERRLGFEALVLRALYLILRAVITHKGERTCWLTDWRADAIGYLDEYGNQTPEAKPLRREKMPE